MKHPLRFVIVGTGNIAKTYKRAIENQPNAAVAGFLSRSKKEDKDLLPYPIFTDFSSIKVDYDAVIICTPNGTHHSIAIQVAELGKHILCEKPIDINLTEIDKMIQAASEHNVRLGVAYQRRFSSDNPIVKDLIDTGTLGRIFSVDLSVKNYRGMDYYHSAPYRGTYQGDGGGPFMQQASHYIDLYLWFFGKPDHIVSKMATLVHEIEVEDHGAAILWHEKGLIGTVIASTATKPGFPAKMQIHSDKGYLAIENDVITEWEIEGLPNPSRTNLHTNQHTGSNTAVVDDTTNHEYVINDFISAIKDQKEPLVSGEAAKLTTEVILEIYKNQFV